MTRSYYVTARFDRGTFAFARIVRARDYTGALRKVKEGLVDQEAYEYEVELLHEDQEVTA